MHGVGDSAVTPAFVTKLWALVEDPSTDHLICWDSSGKSFHVYDQLQFAREVLPLYFKHGNIASFIRQLNMYGFRKVAQIEHGGLKIERDDMEFQHPYFMRGEEVLISQIKRKPPTSGVKVEGEQKLHKEDVNKVLTDMHTLKGKQETINGKLESMRRENEALWREVASLRQKHTQQQQIVNKLIQFLVTVVQKKPGMGVGRRRPLMINDSTEREGPLPSKISRQYSLESVGGTRYTVDMPDTPITPMNRQSGVQIREVDDNLPSPQSLNSPGASTGAMLTDFEEPVLGQDTTNTIPPQTLFEYLQSPANQAKYQTNQPAAKKYAVAAQNQQLPTGSYVTAFPNSNPTGKSLKLDTKRVMAENLPAVTDTNLLDTGPSYVVTQAEGLTTQSMPPSSLAVITDISPSSSLNFSGGLDSRIEVNEHLDTIDSDLEALKDLLASGTYSLDANTLLGLFNPEGPVPQTPEHLLNMDEHPLSGIVAEQKQGNGNNIVGNEVVQYVNPTDDIGDIFDLGEVNTGLDSNQPIFPDLDSDLNTPQLPSLSPQPPSYTKVKQERRPMEEVD